MSWKTWIPLSLAVLLGLVAAIVAKNMMSQNHPGQAQTVKLSKVIVARTDLAPGQKIKADDLAEGQVSPDAVPSGSFDNVQKLVGRVVNAEMVKGQPVLEGQLAPQGAGAGLQSLVPAGMRAITIEVNEFSGVAGLLAPGCHVDVLATIQSNNKPVSRAIVQDVEVTAVGQRLTAQPKEKADPNEPPKISRSVTLLATLKQAEAIELAAAMGHPRLVLRSARDQAISNNSGVTVAELYGSGNQLPVASENGNVTTSTPQPVDIFASNPATTQPWGQKYMVRVFRAGVVSTVALDAQTASGREASNESEIQDAISH